MPFEVGQRIGEYEVLALLGAGGMGRVYRVRNIISNREEAMKVLLPDFASEPQLAARFMAEIRTLAGLEHPNIAQLRTAFQLQNEFVMIMELVEGATLETLAAESKLPLDQALEYSMQALSALAYAHGRGVTHRDIKPANIMVTSHGLVKLMDFGIAKSTDDMQLTRPGTTMGSVYYISPEQVTGGTVDARSDIYSFGVTLYEILTGRKPFQADSSYTVLHAQLNTAPTSPLELNPSLPPALSGIVMHAMQKDPAARFQSAEEFRNALKSLRAPQQAQPVSQPAPQAFAAAPDPGFAPVAAAVSAPAPAQPEFTPVAVAPAVASGSGKSHRGLWIGLGALTAILALAAVATVLPHYLSTHADQKPASGATVTQPAAAQPEAASAAQPSSPASDKSAQPVSTGTTAPVTGATSPQMATPSTQSSSSPARPAIEQAKTSGFPVKHSMAAAPEIGASAPPPAPAQSMPSGPSQQEIRQAHHRMMNLDAREVSIRSGVQQIRSQQQAQGLDIRGDILASMTRMNHLLSEANRELAQNDLQAANESMEHAEAEAAKLEAFLGH